MLASVYWARPPVVFGIRALSSDNDAMVVIFKRQAMTIAAIKMTPMVPAPCPRDVGRILRTFKIKKNVEVTDNGKDNF